MGLWVYGYCSEPAQSDTPDGAQGSQDSRIKSAIISFLGQLGVLGMDEVDTPHASVDLPDARRLSDPAPTTSTPLTPKVVKTVSLTSNMENPPKTLPQADTPKVAV